MAAAAQQQTSTAEKTSSQIKADAPAEPDGMNVDEVPNPGPSSILESSTDASLGEKRKAETEDDPLGSNKKVKVGESIIYLAPQ
jgi:hypothetical protein